MIEIWFWCGDKKPACLIEKNTLWGCSLYAGLAIIQATLKISPNGILKAILMSPLDAAKHG